MNATNWKTNMLRLLGAGVLLLGHGLRAEAPSAEEMWAIIQQQQAEIGRLRALVEESHGTAKEAKGAAVEAQAVAAEARSESRTVQAQVEATALAVEEMGETGGMDLTGWWDRTSIGGYGELHANFYDEGSNEIDLHRFVLFVNHQFNDWINLYTELEVEHSIAGEGQNGEVEMEQAFLRLDWTDSFSTDAGLFLMPVGIINETHEPNTFYGVERNNVESRIIPSTWWEAGVKGTWRFGNGLAVDAAVTSGLDMGPNGSIRGGRQKVSEAINEAPGFSGRVSYTGIPGLEVALSAYYQDDMAQSDPADVQGLLTTAHVDYRKGGFGIRALYARWDLDGMLSADAEEQYGFYIEPSYRWNIEGMFGDIGVYFRYSNYEYWSNRLLENEIYEIGINWWPMDRVVFKGDLQDISNSDQYGSHGDFAFNLGVGYQF